MQIAAVDMYIARFSQNTQHVLEEVRNAVLNCAPGIREQYKYKCPFYDFKGPLIYMYVKPDERIVVGFNKGVELNDELGHLEGDQKQVRHMYLSEVEDLKRKDLAFYLQEAVLLNGRKSK